MFDRDAYLARIKYEGPLIPSLETLQGLHRAHVMTVPFENLDIHLGRSISLAPADLFRKIVVERRGGYCFELNGLFALLLEALGIAVTRLAARVCSGAEGVRPRSHQLLMVKMGTSVWIVDVGFGGQGLLEPLTLAVAEES
ncbi:MAG: arylamine N-acetyltransferase [Nitrospira sp.]|nr:arylamine N-acetyltransferase [Nitrospira sp.]